jgi:hypothetical protein
MKVSRYAPRCLDSEMTQRLEWQIRTTPLRGNSVSTGVTSRRCHNLAPFVRLFERKGGGVCCLNLNALPSRLLRQIDVLGRVGQ